MEISEKPFNQSENLISQLAYAGKEIERLKTELAEIKNKYKWISVEERFPTKDDGDVLLFIIHNGLYDIGWVDGDNIEYAIPDFCGIDKPLFWMPIPKREG